MACNFTIYDLLFFLTDTLTPLMTLLHMAIGQAAFEEKVLSLSSSSFSLKHCVTKNSEISLLAEIKTKHWIVEDAYKSVF